MNNYISGINLCYAAIESGYPLLQIFIEEGNFALLNYMKEKKVSYRLLSRQKMNDMARNHQGIVIEIPEFKTFGLNDILKSGSKNSLIIILDGIEDANNLGAVLRVSDAVGADGVIFRKDRNIRLNPTVARVSTGAIFYVKCVTVVNITATLNTLKTHGYWIVGAEAVPKSIDYRNIKYDTNVALVIGSEGKGLSRLVRENCDYLVSLPMMGKINSLNAAVAAGILSYHIKNDQN